MKSKVTINPASEEEKNMLIKHSISILREEDFSLSEDEEIDLFFYYNNLFKVVNKIEIEFNGINKTLFSVVKLYDVEENECFENENSKQSEKFYTLEFSHEFFEFKENQIQNITLNDFLKFGKVTN